MWYVEVWSVTLWISLQQILMNVLLVISLQAYKTLEEKYEKASADNGRLAGHQNLKQKIQYITEMRKDYQLLKEVNRTFSYLACKAGVTGLPAPHAISCPLILYFVSLNSVEFSWLWRPLQNLNGI